MSNVPELPQHPNKSYQELWATAVKTGAKLHGELSYVLDQKRTVDPQVFMPEKDGLLKPTGIEYEPKRLYEEASYGKTLAKEGTSAILGSDIPLAYIHRQGFLPQPKIPELPIYFDFSVEHKTTKLVEDMDAANAKGPVYKTEIKNGEKLYKLQAADMLYNGKFCHVKLSDLIESKDHPPVKGGIIIGHSYRWLDKLPWSEAVFYSWKTFCTAQKKPTSDLQFFLRNNIENENTLRIIEIASDKAYMQAELKRGTPLDRINLGNADTATYGMRTWTFETDPETFHALLGSELGAGVVRMLRDHSVELGGQTILSIVSQVKWHMSVGGLMFNVRK